MKIIKQLAIIISFYFFGEFIAVITGIPIPGSVIGMCAMLLALASGKLKLSAIQDTADFLLANLALLFIPYAVGLIDAYTQMKEYFIPILVVVFAGTVFTTIITGLVIQTMIKRKKND